MKIYTAIFWSVNNKARKGLIAVHQLVDLAHMTVVSKYFMIAIETTKPQMD